MVAVPVGSIVLAFVLMAFVLLATGHSPGPTYRRLIDAAFFADGAITSTFTSATPILFTGLAAAVAFRMQLFNIGAEGQLYLGAVGAIGVGIWLSDRRVGSTPVYSVVMCVVGARFGAAWAVIDGVLRAFIRTSE